MAEIVIPRFFRPRSYQAEFVNAMREGCKRAAMVWHRRAGKDDVTLNWNVEAMLRRPGGYYYFFPTYKQGKRILWNGIKGDGRPFLEAFPPELMIGEPNHTDMSIKLRCPAGGPDAFSLFQILGADKVDNSSIGTNPVGVTFSEYSLMNPQAWDLMRPILVENQGWAVFVFTPRGRNWGWNLWTHALKQSTWFTSLKTVKDTVRDGENDGDRRGQPVVPEEAVNEERLNGMAEELIQQEFYCSFEGALMGAYFTLELERMRKEGRLTRVPWQRDVPVDTSWDLGVDDETVIGFWQTIEDVRGAGGEYLHLIDVHSGNRMGLDDYWRYLKNEKPYTYGTHYGPHDLSVLEYSGQTRLATAQAIGLFFEVVKKFGVAEGHNAIRRIFPHLWVDEVACAPWVENISAYRREFDEERMTFLDKPVKDRATHWADMTKYRALAYQIPPALPRGRRQELPERGDIDYSVFDDGDDEDLSPFSSKTNWGLFRRGPR